MKMQLGFCLMLLGFGLGAPIHAGAQDGDEAIIGEKGRERESAAAQQQRLDAARAVQLRKGGLTVPVAQQSGLAPRPSTAREPGNHGNTSPKDPTPVDPKGPDKLSTTLARGAGVDRVSGKDEPKDPKEPKEPKDPKGPDKLSGQLLRNDALRTDPALQQVAPARNMDAARRAGNTNAPGTP